MVDYMGAIKRPFSDIQTLIIGIVIGAIPLVGLGFLIPGYLIGAAKDTMGKKAALPAWNPNNIVDYIIKTIMVIIICIVYMIIPVIVILIGAGAIITQLMPAITSGTLDPTMLIAAFTTGGIFLLLGGILGIIAGSLASMGIMFYVKTGELMSAFNISGILKKVLTATYWVSLIVAIVVGIIVSFIAGLFAFIPIVGVFLSSGIALFVNGVIGYTIFAQVFMETP